MKDVSLILLDENDNALGHPNYDRWNKLPLYKRLFGYLFYSYKHKYIDITGFNIESVDGLKKGDFIIRQDGEGFEIDNFKDLGNGSYIVEPKFLR